MACSAPTGGSAVLTGGGEALDVSPSTRCCFAYVPQDNVIFSGTVAETLRLVRPNAPEEALWAALRAACAEDFVRGLPGGLDCPLRERGGSLSEGQNQRLAIARAILADAPILLLDEVTSALDLETEQRVLQEHRRPARQDVHPQHPPAERAVAVQPRLPSAQCRARAPAGVRVAQIISE